MESLPLADVCERYPHVHRLICGYLNEDLFFDYESPERALEQFVSDVAPIDVETAAGDIERLLETFDDVGLDRCLEKFGLGYAFEVDGFTSRSWLQSVRNHLSAGRRTDGTA